jgi:hypothetical protein
MHSMNDPLECLAAIGYLFCGSLFLGLVILAIEAIF